VTEAFDAGTLDFAHRMFDFAREGETEHLTAYVDNELPVNLPTTRATPC
jgi:hypothetical protein